MLQWRFQLHCSAALGGVLLHIEPGAGYIASRYNSMGDIEVTRSADTTVLLTIYAWQKRFYDRFCEFSNVHKRHVLPRTPYVA